MLEQTPSAILVQVQSREVLNERAMAITGFSKEQVTVKVDDGFLIVSTVDKSPAQEACPAKVTMLPLLDCCRWAMSLESLEHHVLAMCQQL